MKKISIITPVFNEEDNIIELIDKVKSFLSSINNIIYEHIFIDNCSTDRSVQILRNVASDNKNIKVILNSKNFGYARSSFYGILQASGDAVILMSADLQDPPYLLKDFIKSWQNGKKIVLAQKRRTSESFLIKNARKIFYRLIKKISDTKLTIDTIGFGIFDRSIINEIRKINDPYPYFRGLITEISEEIHLVQYDQPVRKKGITKFKFLDMYDLAITGIVKHSKIPIRIFVLFGFFLSIFSLIIGVIYFVYKILNWDSFATGVAPLLIGFFILGSLQLFLLGLIGEYIISINSQVRNIPLVFEKERINFD